MASLRTARQLAANPAAVALMIGATQHKAETAAKDSADSADGMKSKSKVSIDIGADGKPVINASAVPLEDAQAAEQDSYMQPYTELAKTINDLRKQSDQDEVDRTLPWSGKINLHEALRGLAQTTATERAIKLRNAYGDASLLREAQIAKRQQQQDAARKNNSVYSAIKSSDLSSINVPDVASRAGASTADITQNPEYMDAIKQHRDNLTLKLAQGRSQDVGKSIVAMKPEDIAGYDNFDSWLADQEAVKGEFTPSERGRAKARFAGYRRELAGKDATAARAAEDQVFQRQRQEAFLKKLSEAGQEKPVKLTIGEARDFNMDDLISMRGEENIHKPTLERRIRLKTSELQRQLSTVVATRDGQRKVLTALTNGGADDEQIARAQASIDGLNAKRSDIERQLKAAVPNATTTPAVGDTKKFPNGRIGKWDGKGWVSVK